MESTLSATTSTLLTLSKTLNSTHLHRHYSTTRSTRFLHRQLAFLRLTRTLTGEFPRSSKFSSISPFSPRNVGGYSMVPPLSCRMQCVSSSAASFASGGGGGSGGSSSGGDGSGGGDDGGEVKENPVRAGPDESSDLSSDVIILDVGGMTCGGCAASVKRILESQPQVSSASVNLATETAIVWPISEAKVAPNWQKTFGDELAKHLTTCGFTSNLRGQAATEGEFLS